MAELPRLNGIIRALEAGQHALTCFSPAEINSAVAISASKFDGCVFEMEHQPWDGRLLRDCLQYMLNRAQIAKAASLVPGVTPGATEPALAIWARLSMYCRQSRNSRPSHGWCSISNTQPSNFEALMPIAALISAGEKHVSACWPASSARMTLLSRGSSAILGLP